MANELEDFAAIEPDQRVRRIARTLLSTHRMVRDSLISVHSDGTAIGWAQVASELGPDAVTRLRLIYRALRDAELAIDPTADIDDVPG